MKLRSKMINANYTAIWVNYIYLLQEWKGKNYHYRIKTNSVLSKDLLKDLQELFKLTDDRDVLYAICNLLHIVKAFLWANKDSQGYKEYALPKLRMINPNRFTAEIAEKAWLIFEKNILPDIIRLDKT